MGRSVSAGAAILVAKAPCAAPNTRAPTGNLSELLGDGLDGAAMTVPANSKPATHGKAGGATERQLMIMLGLRIKLRAVD